jgi:polar amino acid transport system substrate-binding protein
MIFGRAALGAPGADQVTPTFAHYPARAGLQAQDAKDGCRVSFFYWGEAVMVKDPRPSLVLTLVAVFFWALFLAGVAAADSSPTTAAPYIFHAAFESPMKEILEGRIKEAFARLGLRAELRFTPSSQRALMLANQEGDGDAGRVTEIKELAPADTGNLLLVEEPIMIMELAVYTRQLSFPVDGWQSLAGYHNGARIGAKIIEKHIPGQTTFLPTTVQLVQMLDAGRIDTMVEWKRMADHAIRTEGKTGIRQLTPLLKTQPFHLCLHKKHQDLVPRLNEVLRRMKEEGLLDPGGTEFVFYTGEPEPLKEIMARQLREAFARAGNYRLRLVSVGSAQRALIMANEEGDGDVGRVPDIKEIAPADTAHLLVIPEAAHDIRFFVYTRAEELVVDGYESLAPFRNGFRLGAKILEKNIPGRRTVLPEPERLFQMLVDGRLDTVIERDVLADPLIRQHGYTMVRKVSPPLLQMPAYPLIHQRHRDLIPAIVKALREMKADGTYAAIEEEVLRAFAASL